MEIANTPKELRESVNSGIRSRKNLLDLVGGELEGLELPILKADRDSIRRTRNGPEDPTIGLAATELASGRRVPMGNPEHFGTIREAQAEIAAGAQSSRMMQRVGTTGVLTVVGHADAYSIEVFPELTMNNSGQMGGIAFANLLYRLGFRGARIELISCEAGTIPTSGFAPRMVQRFRELGLDVQVKAAKGRVRVIGGDPRVREFGSTDYLFGEEHWDVIGTTRSDADPWP
jgi:hypothetical protein